MGVPDNNLDGLERQRLELESNIRQLQQSLYHWREWEAEYDGLKEEIGELDEDATMDDFIRVSREFGGALLNEDEVRVLIGEKQGLRRTRQQVTDLISRRIDYVRDNVASMEKRLRAADYQLNALDAVEQLPEEVTADFPMKEIIEELDEDGEIISSKTTNPGEQASDLLDILKNAGVKDMPDISKSNPATAATEPTPQNDSPKGENEQIKQADMQEPKLKPKLSENNGVSAVARDGADAAKPSIDPEKEVPIVDVDESPEDAKLRHEMLRYGLDEVGAVVAELEWDENASDVSVDDDYDSYTYEEDEDDEDEDEFGRNTRSVMDGNYHQQMRELEAKLNARGMWNVGKDVGSLPEDVKQDLEQPRIVKVERTPDSGDKQSPKAKPKAKKKVAFAEDLDIASAPVPESKRATSRETEVPVLSDSIVERTEPIETNLAPSDTPKKTSRFRSARGMVGNNVDVNPTPLPSSNTQTIQPRSSHPRTTIPSQLPALPLFPAKPSEPKPFSQPISDIAEKSSSPPKSEGKILADTLFERDISEGTAKAPEPDELDEELHRKEIASEFFRMRNKMAKQNGDHDEESEMVPVETENVPERISKFRASRMI